MVKVPMGLKEGDLPLKRKKLRGKRKNK